MPASPPPSEPSVSVTLVPEDNIAAAGLSVGAISSETTDSLARTHILYQRGQTLAQAVYMSGRFAPPPLCSGMASCGRCRLRLIDGATTPDPASAELLFFTPEELSLGWRLGCRHQPVPGMRVELPGDVIRFSEHAAESVPSPSESVFFPASAGGEASFLAVDLGTTSLQWQHLALFPQGFRIIGQGKSVNPQMGAGSDVVSRLAFAGTPKGRERLATLTRNALHDLAARGEAAMHAHGLPGGVTALCLAANPAMTAITLGLDTESLARAPYSLPYAGGRWEELPGLPRLWTPPQLSPFVGGDIAAGYAALALDPDRPAPAYPFLLADLGTNGEFLLALAPDKALAASVALGPALEGIGLRHGTEARPGAITDFALSPRGLEAFVLPDTPATGMASIQAASLSSSFSSLPGITGTGYLTLLHLLLASGAMDRQGHFTPGNCGVLKRFFTPVKAAASESEGDWLPLPFGLRLTASDVEEVLKVKAAFSLGLRRLLDTAGLASRDLAGVHIAGALGSHVNKQALEELGFFPHGMESRLEASGNTSLAGASLLLRKSDVRPALARWAATVTTIDLASDPLFAWNFAEHMRFVW